MRVVIDTNVLLAALPKFSIYRSIINALAAGEIELVVSTAILLEYQEILSRKTNAVVATNFLEFLSKMPGVVYHGHFDVVKETPFPTIGIINPDEFLVLLSKL